MAFGKLFGNIGADVAGDAAKKALKETTEKAAKEAAEKAAKEAAQKAAKTAAEKVAKEAGEKAAKEAAQKAAKEAVEKAAKEAGEKAAKEAAQKAAKDGLGETAQKAAAKQARETAEDKARKQALDELTDDDLAKKLGDEGSEAVGKNRKVMDWMKKNPGKTAAAAGVAVFGATLLGLGIDRFAENNNKPLSIIKMEDADKKSSQDISLLSTNEKVLITFDPSTKLADGDKIEIADTDMDPPFKGQEFNVDEIVSDTQIKVTFKGIKKYASKGTVILKTTFDNCISQTSKETGETIQEGVKEVAQTVTGSVMDTLLDGPLKPFKDFYEKSKNIINIACLACYYLIFMGIFYKLYKTFS